MSFIGSKPSQTLATPTSQYFNGTGSQTVFTLNRAVNVAEDLEVFVNNIQQEPGVGKSYTAVGTTLTFDAAPSSGTANVYVVYRGLAEVTTRLEHDPNAALTATTGTFSGSVTADGVHSEYNGVSDNMTTSPTASGVQIGSFTNGYSAVEIAGTSGGFIDFSSADGTDFDGRILYAHSNDSMQFYTSGTTEKLRITSSGNVGIGGSETTVFNNVGGDMKFVVIGDDSATTVGNNSDAGIAIVNTNQTAGNLAGLHFARADTDDTPNYAGASIVAQFPEAQVTGQYPKGLLAFLTSTAANSAPSEKMRIDSSGNVGIGTTLTPHDASLTVHDDIKLNAPTPSKQRIYSLYAGTAPYSLGSSGGAAVVFDRLADSSDELAFETHYAGNSHSEKMRISKEGRVTMPYQPSWNARSYGHSTASTGFTRVGSTDNGGTLSFSTQVGNGFNNGRFTAPVTGTYWVHVNGSDGAGGNAGLQIWKNG